jgi:hypothetical protein
VAEQFSSVLCQGVRITADRFDALKRIDIDSHVLAVLTGASVSPMQYQVMTQTPQKCPFCGSE